MEYAALVAGVLFFLAGIFWTWSQSRKTARGTLQIQLEEKYAIWPEAIDPQIGRVLKMQAKDTSINNLVCLHLTVRLAGIKDQRDEALRTPPKQGEPQRPRIDFENFTILAIGTQNDDPNLFQIPIAKANHDRSAFINVIFLRAGGAAQFSILGTKPDPGRGVGATLAPGFVKDMNIVGSGLLHA